MVPVTLRISKDEEAVRLKFGSPEILQRSTDAEAGTVTIQVELPMSDVLLNVILGMGTSVEILAPESLREDLRRTLGALQKLYNKKESQAPQKAIQGDLFDGLF